MATVSQILHRDGGFAPVVREVLPRLQVLQGRARWRWAGATVVPTSLTW